VDVLDGRADAGGRAEGGCAAPELSRVVGRAGELAVVRGLAGEAAAGVGGVLLVAGEQGIGKSALLRAGFSGAAVAGCRVVWGTADELDQMFPLRFITRCLAEAAAGLPGADGGRAGMDGQLLLGGVPAGDSVRAGAERVLAMVDWLCAVSPVVLVAEDLQWADEASLDVWRRLRAAAVQLPLLLAGSFRSASPGGELEGMRREVVAGGGTVVELGPLQAGEVAELAAGVLGARPGERLAVLAGRAGGNPLYVRELLDALVRDGRVAVDAGVAELAGEPGEVPPTLAAAIADRLGTLPGEMLQMLRCAAVLGQEFLLADLNLVAGRPAAEVRRLAELAVVADVLAWKEESEAGEAALGFRHGLIRQAVYDGIPGAMRPALHFQAAQALARAGKSPERVAAQLVAAPGGDEWEAGWLATVPELVYQAPRVAARLLRRALGRLPSMDPRRDALEVELVTASALLLDAAETERVAGPLLARTADPERAAHAAWHLTDTLTCDGRAADALEVADQVLARPGVSDVWAARLLIRKADCHSTLGDLEQGEQVARQALAAAERCGDGYTIGRALHHLAFAADIRRDYAGALARRERALEVIGDDSRSSSVRVLMMNNIGMQLLETDQLAEAGTMLHEGMALAGRTGSLSNLIVSHASAGAYYFDVGRWDDALAVLETVAGMTEVAYYRIAVHGPAALIAGHRDDWAAAGLHLTAVADQAIDDPYLAAPSSYLLRARALAAERAGNPPAAAAVLARCLAPEIAAGMGYDRHKVLPALVRLAVAAGDTATAGEAAEAAAAEAASQPLPPAVATAGVCRGIVESDPGPLLAAAEYYGSAGRPFDRAQALEEAAVLLAERGDLEEARRAYAVSAAGYDELRAGFDLRRADVRMRALGVRRTRPGRRQAPSHGWAALTSTEREIAGLVARGQSNPDIAAELVLSRSTVQTHVSHILAKLGARSRADIIRHALHA
jgi:DNA-binding NarL/FixJ family response regulator